MENNKPKIIEALERALQTARNDAAGYAEMGQTEDSIHADGVADGLNDPRIKRWGIPQLWDTP